MQIVVVATYENDDCLVLVGLRRARIFEVPAVADTPQTQAGSAAPAYASRQGL